MFVLTFLWVVPFAAAAALFFLGRSNNTLITGVAMLGLAPFLIWISDGDIDESVANTLWLITYLAGFGLIFAGAGGLSFGQAGGYIGDSPSSLIIPRNDTNSFSQALVRRDEIYDRIIESCESAGIEIVGYKSRPEHGNVWLRIHYQVPQEHQDLSLRSTLTIYVERFDFHRFEHLLRIEMEIGGRTRTYDRVIELSYSEIEGINRYLAGQAEPWFAFHRTQASWIQFWRPANKVKRLRPDWIIVGMIAGIAIPAMIPYAFPISLVVLVVLILYLRYRRIFILTTGKPLYDPRSLIRMDGWQATVDSLAEQLPQVREAVLDRLGVASDPAIRVEPERIWYAGPDGKVEREQITVSLRRAIAFVHLEGYGTDMYVGWDSHANTGTWVEETLQRGVDRDTGINVVANRVVSARSQLNEYDMTDASFLSEWLHATLTKIIKLKMEEQRIDQEIDFTIQRESRRDAVAQDTNGPSASGGLWGALRRVS